MAQLPSQVLAFFHPSRSTGISRVASATSRGTCALLAFLLVSCLPPRGPEPLPATPAPPPRQETASTPIPPDILRRYIRDVVIGDGRLGEPIRCKRESGPVGCEKWTSMVDRLNGLALSAPADTFVQNVAFYSLVRLEAFDDAIALLRARCWADEWWCAALQGFVYAERGSVLEAEAAFDAALAAMPRAEWCLWNDLSFVMPIGAWDAYVGDTCMTGPTQLADFWWLADPAWMVPGNDRKVEHYDRMVLLALHDVYLSGESGDAHVDDDEKHSITHHRDAIGYGDDRRRESMRWIVPREGAAVGVLPEATALVAPLYASPADWLVDPAGKWERYVPYSRSLAQLEDYQVAFFERGDSVLVVAAIGAPDDFGIDETPTANSADAATIGLRGAGAVAPHAILFFATDRATPLLTVEPGVRNGGWFARTTIPRRRFIVSIEAASDAGLARARFGHGLAQDLSAEVRLSDLLLYSPDGPLPDSLSAAEPLMKAGTTWRSDEPMGVFLEVYGPNSIASYPISVELSRAGGEDETTPINIQWAQPGSGGRYPVSFTLDLRDASEGAYTLRVMIGSGPGAVSAVKAVSIER